MALNVRNVAHLDGQRIVITASAPLDGNFAVILTSFEPLNASALAWTLELVIGEGVAARRVEVRLAPFLSQADFDKSSTDPIIFYAPSRPAGKIGTCAFFRNRFFMPEREPRSEGELEELSLRVKRLAYKEDEELNSLRAYVSNMEAVEEYRSTGPQRLPIPSDVKLVVWSRDGGACAQCGSKENIHFDHIIPVAKGGGNGVENIQVLCAPCNLRKSDKIAN